MVLFFFSFLLSLKYDYFYRFSSIKLFSVPLSSSLLSEGCKPTTWGVHPPSFQGQLISFHLGELDPVMSEYHKIDTNEYPNIFGWHIMYRMNIRIYSDATYLPNEYPNIFVFQKQHKYEYKYYSRVILFEYSNIRTHHWLKEFFKRAHSCFLWIKFYTGYFLGIRYI